MIKQNKFKEKIIKEEMNFRLKNFIKDLILNYELNRYKNKSYEIEMPLNNETIYLDVAKKFIFEFQPSKSFQYKEKYIHISDAKIVNKEDNNYIKITVYIEEVPLKN